MGTYKVNVRDLVWATGICHEFSQFHQNHQIIALKMSPIHCLGINIFASCWVTKLPMKN